MLRQLRRSGHVSHHGCEDLHAGVVGIGHLQRGLDHLEPEHLLLPHEAESWSQLSRKILHEAVLLLQPVLVEGGPNRVQV